MWLNHDYSFRRILSSREIEHNHDFAIIVNAGALSIANAAPIQIFPTKFHKLASIFARRARL
jgi:hypothetical protein